MVYLPFKLLFGLIAMLVLTNMQSASAQDSGEPEPTNGSSSASGVFVVGRPFSAIKYTRRVRILPDGKQRFLANERYPVQIGRDADGRLMVQGISRDDLGPECDMLEVLVPPACSAWNVLVVDPVARVATHWVEGEIAGHVAVQSPVSQDWLDQAVSLTSELPELPPDFASEDGEVRTADLGDKEVDGIVAHGVLTTLRYSRVESGKRVRATLIHEVWTSPEMKLIVKVIDGDPNGEETVWGLEKVSLQPDPSLFRPPGDYKIQHAADESLFAYDLQYLESWFAR
jgi:hypothetical protein